MTDEEIVLYFNEHRLAKLESYLHKETLVSFVILEKPDEK